MTQAAPPGGTCTADEGSAAARIAQLEEALRAERRARRLADREVRQWRRVAETSENLSERSKHASLKSQGALEATIAELDRARREAEEAVASKSRFLAMMSHELRTPMHGVLGGLELLERDTLAHSQAELVRVATQSSRALLSVINDILDYSKLEAGAVVLERHAIDPVQLAEEVLETFRSAGRGGALDLRVQLDGTLPGRFLGDATRIRQVLLNLVGNAVKFTEQGEVVVRVRGEHDLLWVGVQDTGIGIPAGRVDALFQLFTQADETTTRRFGGTGLGLAICRLLCEAMDGRIGVDSEPGVGSTFWFELAADWEAVSASSEAPDRVPSQKVRAIEGLGRVLVVDDNPINRLLARRMLTRLGVASDEATGGAEAVQLATQAHYAAVLMDCSMPEVDGYEATRRLRKAEAGGDRATPVIAMTAFTGAAVQETCAAAGMDGYLAKPTSIVELRRLLLEVADRTAG